MNDVDLPALSGANPVGFLAALGVLDAAFATHPDASLRWTDELVPHAVLGGAGDLDLVLDVLDQDRAEWAVSTALHFPPDSPLNDAKPDGRLLRRWFEAAAEKAGAPQHDVDLLCAMVAEGAFDGNQKAKPTHLHFMAGQQQFLEPLWSVPGRRDAVRSLVADRTLISDGARLRAEVLEARGIFSVLRAPIRRTDQGGYGSFGSPEVLARAVVTDLATEPVPT